MPSSRSFLLPLLTLIVRRFGAENLGQISASLAFTTLLALVPLAALALALVAAFPAFASFIEHVDKLLVGHLLPPGSAGLISAKLLQFSRRAAEVSGWGVTVLVVTTFLLMNTIERAFNHVWRVRWPRPIWQRFGLYAIVVVVWPLCLGALLAGTSAVLTASFGLIGELRWARAPLFKGLSSAVMIVFFAFLYRAVPNAKVAWRDALIAGAIAALGFIVLQRGFELYLAFFPSYRTIYGAFATVPIFLLWVYLSWAVVLVGALVAASLPEVRGAGGRRHRR